MRCGGGGPEQRGVGWLASIGSTPGLSTAGSPCYKFSIMPKSTVCLMRGINARVTVPEAKKLSRNERRNLVCLECKERVKPHKASDDGSQAAHFEHLARNERCSLSDHRYE